MDLYAPRIQPSHSAASTELVTPAWISAIVCSFMRLTPLPQKQFATEFYANDHSCQLCGGAQVRLVDQPRRRRSTSCRDHLVIQGEGDAGVTSRYRGGWCSAGQHRLDVRRRRDDNIFESPPPRGKKTFTIGGVAIRTAMQSSHNGAGSRYSALLPAGTQRLAPPLLRAERRASKRRLVIYPTKKH